MILVSLSTVVGVACTPTGAGDDGSWTSPADGGCQWGPVAEDGGVEGTAVNGEFWVLVPGAEMLRPGQEFKVVFRLTGSGPADAFVISPDGREVAPTRPLRPHVGSNVDRPGEEWGAFFEVDEPGCWELVVERDGTTGVLPLPITAS